MNTFESLGLPEEVLRAVKEMGFEKPTEVQEEAIPQILSSDRDLVALAQTGTGKTAAFSLPLLKKIDSKNRKTQVIILSPTRELCLQIAKNVEDYSKYIEGFQVAAVYGGASIDQQIRQLKRGAQFVVGTPGRTLDLLRRKVLDLSHIQWVVLDEADEMLSMGFTEDLNSILATTPEEKQVLLFSATMPAQISRIAKNYMTNPLEIAIGSKNVSAKNVTHLFFMAQARDRYLALKRIVDVHPKIYGIIFCRTRRETKDIADNLMQEGYSADAIHGDLSQVQRSYVMNRFRNRNLQLLVATDVAARGVDVEDLTHVINYNLPDDPEIYIHRSGRTGRAGKSGTSIIIVHSREQHKIRVLEKKIQKKIERQMIPTGREVCESQLFNLIDRVENIEVKEGEIGHFLPETYAKLEKFTREELIQRFISVEFNQFLKYYENAPDINISSNRKDRDRNRDRDRGDRGDRRDRGDRGRDRDSRRSSKGGNQREFTRFKLNFGRKQNANPKMVIQLINKSNPRLSIDIGGIDIFNNFTFFDGASKHESEIIQGMNQLEWDGVSVSVEKARAKSKGGEGFKDKPFHKKKDRVKHAADSNFSNEKKRKKPKRPKKK